MMDGVFGCTLALVVLQVVSGQSSFGSSELSFFGAEGTTVLHEQCSSPLPPSTLLVQSLVPSSTQFVQRFVSPDKFAVYTFTIVYVW